MIGNLNQSTRDWLADVVENLGLMLSNNEDPSIELDLFGSVFEIRINKLSDGSFERIDCNLRDISSSNKLSGIKDELQDFCSALDGMLLAGLDAEDIIDDISQRMKHHGVELWSSK